MRTLSLFILPLVLFVSRGSGARQLDPVQREFAVREWALDPRAHRVELAAALRSEDWRVRFDALDALRRARACGVPVELPAGREALLADPHPNVRASGVAVVLRERAELEAGELERLVNDPFPGVRMELARALGGRSGTGAAAALLELSFDEDARVADAAARLSIARGPEYLAAKLELMERGGFDRDPVRFAEFIELCLRAPPDPEWFDAVRRSLVEGRTELEEPDRRGMRAMWEALSYARMGAGDARVLAQGWLQPVGEAGSRVARSREELLSRAARSGDRALFDALLDELERHAADWPAGRAPARVLLDAALEAADDGAAMVLLERLEPLPDSLSVRALNALAGRVDAWHDDALERWLDPAQPVELRTAACGAAGDAFVRARHRASGAALERCLEDPDEGLRWSAFQALCEAADPRPWLAGLHRFWGALPERELRLEALRQLPRRVALTPFRDDLIASWQSAAGRVPSVLELLAAFRGDAELADEVSDWLEFELALLSRSEPPPEEITEGPWRRAEGRAQALVRTLDRIAGAEAVDRIEAVLARVDGRSPEVAKVCAAALAHSTEGRRRLVGWMRPDASSRVRIEAALGLISERTDAAVTLLLERYPSCDEELRLRVLRAFGPLEDVRCLPLLVRAASEGGHSAAERVVALEALGKSARKEAAVAALASILKEADDADLERGAVASLGKLDQPSAVPVLLALLEDPARAALARDEALPALARLAPEWIDAERVGELLLVAPLAHAIEELEARFLARRLPSREFLYRGELEAARILAERGLLGVALDCAPRWWTLDGRLLLEIGRAAAATEERESAGRMLRAARVALAGEAPAPDLDGQQCGARAVALGLAMKSSDWRAAEATAAELLVDWRTGTTSRRAFQVQLGDHDPRRGRDPEAWLAATELQAAALAALAAGAPRQARTIALRAARSVGRSALAREQQAALETALH